LDEHASGNSPPSVYTSCSHRERERRDLRLIETVARRLGPLRERVAFVGGATTALLVTDPAARTVRATIDVDVIVEVVSYLEYQLRLGEDLKQAGFEVDTSEGAPLCRWIVEGVTVDVMPTDTSALGFSNQWYSAAIRNAEVRGLADASEIRLVTAPYFLATKLEAFRGRGGGDFMASHDLEDIVTVIDGRATVVDEVVSAPPELRVYLAEEFARLLDTDAFIDALPGHLPGDRASASHSSRPLCERSRGVGVKVVTANLV
jgi:hypothetical protein